MNTVRRATRLLVVALSLTIAAGVAYAVWLSDHGTVNVQVTDRTGAVVDATTAEGAFVSYFGDLNTTFGSSGTGTFNPFVRLQADATEQGYNTNGTTEFDTKVGKWTHAILVSQIPQRPCPQLSPTRTCFELFVDINDNNSTPYISLNRVEVYFTASATLTGYDFGSSATPQYKFAGDVLIHDVNQGSGRGDLRYDIPINDPAHPITLPPNCSYGNPACTTYFVLYSQWGTTTNTAPDGKTYSSDGGFEEWKVKVYPAITLTKTPSTTDVCDGSNAQVTYTYVVTNTGTVAVTGPVVDDNATPGNTADDVTVGTFSGLAPGASQTFTHVFTANGTRTNIATATATAPDGLSTTATATATVTGHDCTIKITKSPSTNSVCNGSNTSVTYTYVVTNNSDFFNVSGSVSDDVNGSIGSFGPLAPGASATLTKAATVTGSVTNTGTATGTFDDLVSTSATASASATVTGHTCTISLTKTPSTTDVCSGAGTQVTYTYVVKNTGDFFNVSGSVSDNVYGSIGSFGPLAPGTSATLTKVATVNATVTNTGTASGTFDDPKPTTASATASATVTARVCSISLTKTPSITEVCNGSNTSVTYTYVVTNTGNFFEVSGSVSDNVYGSIGSFGPLAPSQSATLTKVATVSGTVTNIGTATGTFTDSKPTTAQATASATVTGKNCSQITPTNTTCSTFSSGTATTLDTLLYTVKSGTINSVAPGVFFYWIGLQAAAGSNTFTIHQAITTGNFDSHFFSFAAGSNAFNASCTSLGASVTQSGGDVTVTFSAASAGTVYLGIKFDATSVKGFAVPNPTTVHYTFETLGQAGSQQGLDLKKK